LKPKVQPGTRVAVLGAGSWGTTFAKILADGGADVMLWARRPELAKEISEGRRNSDYLPGINLPVGLRATSRLDLALAGAQQVFVSVPSQSLRENLVVAEPYLAEGAIVVSLMKGVERATGMRMSEVIEQVLAIDPSLIAAISGPNLALEIAKEQPTAAVVSSVSLETAQAVAKLATARYFRSYVNTDVIGTEFGGVLKNLIAVAIGIVDGVGYGENTKASIITRRDDGLRRRLRRAGGDPGRTGRARRSDRDLPVPALPQQHRRAPARAGLQLQRRGQADAADHGGPRLRGPHPRPRPGQGRRDAHRRAGAAGLGRYAETSGPCPAPHHRLGCAAGRKDNR
jgi:glycerol-3-phosphate dehydrogenase